MDNLEIYNRGRSVPSAAKRTIKGGRLNGKTDINPMWRISVLTEMFGPCGLGWKYTITRQEMVPGANGEVSCFVDIELRYSYEGVWSEPIPGTGGSSFIAKERDGLYTSDECFKMALTDALSVACKALGVGADVYWEQGSFKYTQPQKEEAPKKAPAPSKAKPIAPPFCECCGSEIQSEVVDGKQYTANTIAARAISKYGMALCYKCLQDYNAEAGAEQ